MHYQLVRLLAVSLLVESALGTPTAPAIHLVDGVSRPSRADLEAECGALGVMEVPEGENPLEYRHCREHPSFLDETAATTPNSVAAVPAAPAAARALACLEFPGSRGCSAGKKPSSGYHKEWCWRGCGTPSQLGAGYWCWLAWNGGRGDWVGCTAGGIEDTWPNQSLCNEAIAAGASCGVGGCNSCGCGC